MSLTLFYCLLLMYKYGKFSVYYKMNFINRNIHIFRFQHEIKTCANLVDSILITLVIMLKLANYLFQFSILCSSLLTE